MRLRTASAAFLPSRCYMQPTLFYFIFFSSIRYDKKAERFVTVAVAHMPMISEPKVSEWASLRYVLYKLKSSVFNEALSNKFISKKQKISALKSCYEFEPACVSSCM